jgi:hypothetical protein
MSYLQQLARRIQAFFVIGRVHSRILWTTGCVCVFGIRDHHHRLHDITHKAGERGGAVVFVNL